MVTISPPSAHLEQQAREVLADECEASGGPATAAALRAGEIGGYFVPSECVVRAMLAFRDAPKPAPEHHELREKVARIIDPHGFRQWQSMYDYGLRVGDSEGQARGTADWAHAKQKEDALAKADAILALISNPSPDTSELVDGIGYV